MNKDDYISAVICIYELQDLRPLLDLYVFSYLRTCGVYDETVKAVGFDEVRVRYRTERRALLRRIILGELKERDVSLEAVKIIPKEALQLFIEDVSEDLRDMDQVALSGLGLL